MGHCPSPGESIIVRQEENKGPLSNWEYLKMSLDYSNGVE